MIVDREGGTGTKGMRWSLKVMAANVKNRDFWVLKSVVDRDSFKDTHTAHEVIVECSGPAQMISGLKEC